MNRAFAGTLAAAALLHAGLIVAASRLPAPRLAPIAPIAPPRHAIQVELFEPPARAVPAPTAVAPDTEPAEPTKPVALAEPERRVASTAPSRRAAGAVLALPGGDTRAGLPSTVEPGALPAPGNVVPAPAPAPRRPVDLGLGGDIYWMMRNEPVHPPDRVAARRRGPRTAGGLAEALEASDREKGLGRGGPVVIAAREVANTQAPERGRATFIVETDPRGRVRSVRLVSASADPGLWYKVARGLRAALLRRAALRVPPGARGLRVGVLVEARVQMPSGAEPGSSVRFKGAGLGFDVADIGATPTRVVSARITSETVL